MGGRRQTDGLALDVESARLKELPYDITGDSRGRRRGHCRDVRQDLRSHGPDCWCHVGGRALKAAARLAAGAALAALLALAGPSGANDSIANLETGGLVLVKNTDVEMRSEDLYISDKAVRVKYVFVNA